MTDRELILPEGMEDLYHMIHGAPGVRDGDFLFVAGLTGINAQNQHPDDPKEQFTLAFENVKRVLDKADATFDDVVELTTYHVGLAKHILTFAEVKDCYIKEPYPAWTGIGVAELAFGALAEVKVTARLNR